MDINTTSEARNPMHEYKIGWHFYLLLVILILSGTYLKYFMFVEEVVQNRPLNNFPHVIGSWKNTGDHRLSIDVLDILKVDDYIMRNYQSDGGAISSLYIGYYKTHRRSAEIHTPEHCQAGGGWEILTKERRQYDIPGVNEHLNLIEAVYEKDQEKRLFIYWYLINGKHITNFFHYKMRVILNALLYKRSDATFVRITVPINNDNIDSAIISGKKFLLDALPVIHSYLPKAERF